MCADNVVGYEVLADGSVVVATAEGKHIDWFTALKVGLNNLGVVTSFDMASFKGGGCARWGYGVSVDVEGSDYGKVGGDGG